MHSENSLKPFFCIGNLKEMLNLDLSIQKCALHTLGIPVSGRVSKMDCLYEKKVYYGNTLRWQIFEYS